MNVFVSYQRADTAMAAHALFYALRLEGHRAYIDTGDIGVGQLYRQVISDAIAKSNLVLALIGPAFDPGRLGEPTSVVAFEWQRARFHGAAVVPLLVDGGAMPRDDQLPAQLRWFTRRNAMSLRRASFSTISPRASPPSPPWPRCPGARRACCGSMTGQRTMNSSASSCDRTGSCSTAWCRRPRPSSSSSTRPTTW